MGLFSWLTKRRTNSEKLTAAVKTFENVKYLEVDATKNAINHVKDTLSLLEHGEEDIQKIFTAVEHGKLTDNLIDELTNELVRIEKSRQNIKGSIGEVIDSCKSAIKVEYGIIDAARKSNLEIEKLKELRTLGEDERQLLKDAEDMMLEVNKIIEKVDDILKTDVTNLRTNPKVEANILRKKQASMNTNLLKLQNDLEDIQKVLRDVILLSKVADNIGLDLSNTLRIEAEELEKGKQISGGVEQRKVSKITKDLK